MTVTVQWVNDRGLEEIRAFLAAKYKKAAARQLTRDVLLSWARVAEHRLFRGQAACIEIKANDSITGNHESYCISHQGLDHTAFDDGL